jgi:hypothetical protein
VKDTEADQHPRLRDAVTHALCDCKAFLEASSRRDKLASFAMNDAHAS